MKDDVLKKSIIIISFVVLLVCAFSCVSAQDNNADLTMLSLSKGGLSINYPSNWGYSDSSSNYSIMAISKLDSIDSSGIGQVNINFEKKAVDGDLDSYLNKTYTSMQRDSSFNLTSAGDVMVDGIQAHEYMYYSSHNDTMKGHKAVWFEKGGQAYVMLYSAPVSEYDDNVYVFNYILSDIQIT